jgi:hypothetical protein
MYIRSIALGKSLFIAHAISSWRTALSTSTKYSYDSFGNITALTGSLTGPFPYPAREFDPETGFRLLSRNPGNSRSSFQATATLAGELSNSEPRGSYREVYKLVESLVRRLDGRTRHPFIPSSGLCVNPRPNGRPFGCLPKSCWLKSSRRREFLSVS